MPSIMPSCLQRCNSSAVSCSCSCLRSTTSRTGVAVPSCRCAWATIAVSKATSLSPGAAAGLGPCARAGAAALRGALARALAVVAETAGKGGAGVLTLVAAGAYAVARTYAADPRFSFGTGKLGYLAGFANA